jgi:hypothetical protein
MLKINRVQNLIRNVMRYNAHDRQNLEIDDDLNFVFFFFVIDFQIESFVVVVVFFSLAFIISIVSSFVEFIAISLEIKLFAMLVRRMILFFVNIHILTMMMTTFLIFKCAFN